MKDAAGHPPRFSCPSPYPQRTRAERLWRTLSPLLTPLSWPYAAVVAGRRRWWRTRARSLECPVVSVGNLTWGGTGKTPTVEMVVRDLRDLGWKPAIVSRGYGAWVSPRGGARPSRRAEEGAPRPEPLPDARRVNDEYQVLATNLPDVPHFQGADRHQSGRRALGDGANIVVLDDGFQHVRLRRNLDFVLIDALDPFGVGRLLPAGNLREPLGALRCADLLGITRADLQTSERLGALTEFLEARFPQLPRVRLGTTTLGWTAVDGSEFPDDCFRGESVLAFCGIGNPAAFQLQILGLGVDLRSWIPFADHHVYSRGEIVAIARRARELGVAAVLMTQKDAVKLRRPELREAAEGPPWLYLRIAQTVEEGGQAYGRALEGLGTPPQRR